MALNYPSQFISKQMIKLNNGIKLSQSIHFNAINLNFYINLKNL